MIRLHPGNLAGDAQNQPHQVREGVPVVAHFSNHEIACDVEAAALHVLGRIQHHLAHLARHPRAETAEQVLLDFAVVGIHHVVAFLEFRDKVVQGIQRGLAVVVQRHDVLAGTLAVAGHQGGMLPEVLGEVDADDVILFLREPFDNAPHVVGAAIVHQHNLVTIARALGGHLALDFFHHRSDGLFGTIAGYHK